MAEMDAGNRGVSGKSPLRTRSFRSTSRPRRTSSSSVLGHCIPVPFPSGGDGVSSGVGGLLLNPSNEAFSLSALLTNSIGAQNRRRSSSVNKDRTITFKPTKVENHFETPIHQISQAAIAGISHILTSTNLKKTASSILTSAVRIGSQIFNKGMDVASNMLGESESEIPVKEDAVICRGYMVKTQGKGVTLRSVHLEPTGLLVRIQLGPKLTSSASTSWDKNALTLSFQSGNVVEITSPNGSSPGDINWDTSDDGALLTLHLQAPPSK